LAYSEDDGEIFLGRSVTQHKQVSDVTAHAIDEEIRSIIDNNYRRAQQILQDHLERLHSMAEALIKYETIDESQIKDIMAGREPRPPADWTDTGPAVPTGSDETKPKESAEPNPIAGPASQH
jgi:cell division protease FtsH